MSGLFEGNIIVHNIAAREGRCITTAHNLSDEKEEESILVGIHNIRVSWSNRREVEITFKNTERKKTKRYQVTVEPKLGKKTVGKIKQNILQDLSPEKDNITLKYPFLKEDIHYTFKIRAIYKDDCLSQEWSADFDGSVRTTQDFTRSATDEDIGPISGFRTEHPKLIDANRGSVIFTWKEPISPKSSTYKIKKYITTVYSESSKLEKLIAETEENRVEMKLECTDKYHATVSAIYWDVDNDCESVTPQYGFPVKVQWPNNTRTISLDQGNSETGAERCLDLCMKVYFGHKVKPDKNVFEGCMLPYGEFDQRKVAVKAIHESTYDPEALIFGQDIQDKPLIRRMIREAQHLLELVHHPNIAHYIHSFGDEKLRKFYLIMELCENTLEDVMLTSKEKFEDRKHCKTVILQITLGLRYMHENNICHRDLKPSNILFTCGGKIAKICDFGFAMKVNHDDIPSTRSKGTDGYRAPETYEVEALQNYRNQNLKITDCLKRSDVFSLGLIYFYILSRGRHPFGDKWDVQRPNIRQQKNKVVEGLRGPDAGLADDLIRKMLEYRNEKRPMADELLKHPYFWSTVQIVEFYIRVVDHLDRIYERKIDTASEGFCSKSADLVVKIIKSLIDSRYQVEKSKTQIISEEKIDEADSAYKTCEKIVSRFPDAVVELESEDESQNSSSDDNDNVNTGVHNPNIFSEDKEKEASVSEDQIDEIYHLNDESSVLPVSLHHSNLTESKNLDIAKITVRFLVQECVKIGCSKHEVYELLKQKDILPTVLWKDLVEEMKKKRSNSGSSVEFLPFGEIDTKECPVNLDFPLSSEFITETQKNNLKEIKNDIDKYCHINQEKNQPLLVKAVEKFLIAVSEVTGYSKEQSKRAMIPSCDHANDEVELVRKLNGLKFPRKAIGKEEFEEVKMQMEESLKKGNSVVKVYRKISSLYQRILEGENKQWKRCFKEEMEIQKHGPCCHWYFVENAQGCDDKICTLVTYIRNNLVHIERNKHEYSNQWPIRKDDILNFVAAAVPELLPHVFNVMRHELAGYIDANKRQGNCL